MAKDFYDILGKDPPTRGRRGPDCPYCGSQSHMVDGSEVYGEGWEHVDLYLCDSYPRCDAYVGVYSDGRPKGTLANPETREARKETHKAFDVLWKDGHMTRRAAYRVLEGLTGFRHIGDMQENDCIDALKLINQYKKQHLSNSIYEENEDYWSDHWDF